MLKIWINKCIKEDVIAGYESALHFNILEDQRDSNVKTDIENLWRHFKIKTIDSCYEDFMIIAMAVFSVDKKISRSDQNNPRKDAVFPDAWTRSLHLNIPVLNLERWDNVKGKLEIILSFLTGDLWEVEFRKTKLRYRQSKNIRMKPKMDITKINSVSLFSGGLDSYCGALKLMEKGYSTAFVGFKEYNALIKRQTSLFENIDNYYEENLNTLRLFNVRPYAPVNSDGEKIEIKGENSSRSRSILFIAGALIIASLCPDVEKIHIPENGFIGINVPISDSRQGSCSTRTTHPFFINELNQVLNEVGITRTVENFYSGSTKGELVEEFKNHKLFIEDAGKTISCSHPAQARYDGYKAPMNCGYCYPCIIRKASLHKTECKYDDYNPDYNLNAHFLNEFAEFDSKSSDFRAILSAIRNYEDIKNDTLAIENMLLKHGKLTYNELLAYKEVYVKSMQELNDLIRNSDDSEALLEYIGI